MSIRGSRRAPGGVAGRDPGLQPERTELSWRRTLLALAVGALVSVRVLPDVLGDWTIVTGIGGVLVAVVLWVLARRRHATIAAAFARVAASGFLSAVSERGRASDPGRGAAVPAPAPARPSEPAMPGGALLAAVAVFTSAGAALGLLYAAAELFRLR